MSSHQNTPCFEVSDARLLVKKPVVSVHMITYNHEHYLAEAIEGVLKQKTEYPYELIIGEDCSKDKTREIALGYQRRFPDKIRVLYSDANVGWRTNAHRVSKSCRGQYISFCEGDDYWHSPQTLQKQVDFLENNPAYVLVHSACNIQIGDHILPQPSQTTPVPAGRVFEQLLERNFITTCTVCLARSVEESFQMTGYAKNDYFMGDYPCWLYASQKGLIGYIGESLATYRKTPGSLTNRGSAVSLKLLLSGRQVKNDFIHEFGCSAETLSRVRKRIDRSILVMAWLANDRRCFSEEYQAYQRRYRDWRSDYEVRGLYVLLFLRLRIFVPSVCLGMKNALLRNR